MIAEEGSAKVEYQVSVFGTPVPMRTINPCTPLEPPVRTFHHNQQCQYDIVFPPGAMGLELEPVITSSERTIGCRVKDFYFGVAYDGIDQAYLQEHVMIGDIIAKVNDVSVVSLPFSNILDMLRSMTSTTRHIVFKNITASWEASYKSSHQQVSPTTTGVKGSKVTPSKSRTGSSKARTAMSDTENIANAKKVSNTRDEPAALAQIRAQQVAAQARGPDTTLQRKLSVLSPKKPPSGAENNLSTGSSRSGSSKSSGNIKSGVPVSAITIYEDNRKQMALSPSRNRNPAQQTQVFDAMSVAESSVNSPFKLRKPEETDSLNNTFTFSVQDVDVSTVHSMASARPTRSPSAHSSSPNPRAKQLGSLNSSGKHAAAALLLNRSSSGVVPPLRDGCSSPLTPSSILRLKQQQRASGSLSPVVSRVHTPTRTHQARTPLIHLPAGASAGSADIRNAEQLMEPLEHLRMSECESIVPEQQEEEGREEELPQMQLPVVPHRAAHHHPHETQQSAFAHILDRVRGSIGTGLVQVGSVLGARAEKALADTSHLLPLYSTTEMNQVMTKKYDLLSELSHSCMLLGEAEAKEKAYAEQLAHMRALEDQVSDLQTALEEAQQSKESLQFKVKAAETEVSVLKVEKAEDKELLSTYQAEIKQQNEQLTAQAAQISTMDERLSSATAENNHLRSEWRDREGLWQTQLLTVQEENRVYREQAQSCTATLQAAQAERDHSVAELEVLQEMAAADKQAAMSEFARLREGMASQQYLYKEQLIKHDAEMHQLRRALSEAQSGLEAITELHKASEHAKAQLETKVASASAEVLQLTAKYTMCQQDLRASEEAKEYNRKLAVQAQSQLKEQQMQLVISSSEHGMLSDQARLAALTVEALHSEINMLRRDLEVQRDEISQKGIELKTATTKQHGAEELIESLRTEMATALANSADDLQGKDEEIDQLKQTLDMLRQDRANETEDLTRLTAERDSCAREVSELKEVSATSSARVSELSAQLGAATQKIRDLEQEKMELVEARQTVVAEMNSDMDAMKSILSNQLSAMQTEKAAEAAVSSDIITSLKRNFSEAEAQFHTALQQRDSELSSVRSKASCVEDTLSQVRQEMTRLSAEHRQQLARKDDEIVALAEKYQQAEARARELSASHDKAMSSATQRFEQREKEFLSALSLAEDTQDSLRSDLHQQLSQTSKQCTEQSLLIKDLQAKLQESLVVASSKADEITLRVEEIALLRSEVQDKAAQIALLESKATVAADAAKQSSAQMAKIKEDVAALKQQLQAKSAEADKAGALAAFQQTSFAMKEDKLTQEMQLLQSQLDTSADKLAASTSARRTERAQLFVALQGVQMELAELRSNLKETKVDIAGLGGVHSSIVRSLSSQTLEAKAELAALLGRQPGALKLESRLTQLLQEKEAASRRAAVAEQNTIESEARCVNALTKAMAAEKSHTEAKSTIMQLRESIAALETAVAEVNTENAAIAESKDGLNRKLQATSDECAALQRQVHEKAQEIEQLQTLMREAHAREKRALQVAAEEATQLKATIEALQRERQEWERTASSSQAEKLATAARIQIQCSALQEQLSTATQRAVSEEKRWTEECETLQHQMQTIVASNALERAQLEDQCTALQAQVQKIEEAALREKSHWEQQRADLQQRFLLSQQQIADLQEQSELSQQQIADLQGQYEHSEQHNADLQESLSLSQQHLTSLLERFAQSEQRLAHLQEQHASSQQQSASEKELVAAELEAKLLNQAQEFNRRFEETVREHTAKLDDQQAAQRASIEREKSAHAESTRSLQEHYKLLVEELGTERDQVCEALESAHLEIQQLQTALQEADTEKSRFEQQVTLHTASQSATQHQVVALQNQLSIAQQEAELLKATNEANAAKAVKEIAHLEQAVQEERTHVSLLEANLSGLEESLTESKAAYEVLREKLKQTQLSEDAKGTSLQAAESLVASLQAQLAEIKSAHASLRTEHSTCRAQLEEINADLVAKLEVISTLNTALKEGESKAAQHHGNVDVILKDLEISQERKKELKQQLAHAQLAQRAAEKQSNIFKAQVQELRDTLMTQQNVILEAETREVEHNANRRKLELLLSEGETRYVKLQTEYKQMLERGAHTRASASDASNAQLHAELRKVTTQAASAQKALDEKCAELQSLHQHVTELLTNTFSPRKDARRLPATKTCDASFHQDQENIDKENVLTEVLIEQLQDANACAFEITEAACSDSQWHSSLVECSLGVYELLVAAFQQLQLQHAAVLTDSVSAARESMDKFNRLCVCLSHSQHQLHHLLMQVPWMRLPGHAEVYPSLTAAHEHFNHLTAPSSHMLSVAESFEVSRSHPVQAEQTVQIHAAPTRATGPAKTSAVIAHKAAVEKSSACPASPHPVMHSAPLHGSPGADRAEEDDHVRTSNDSATLEDLLASLACNQSGVSSSNSSVCSALRSHRTTVTATATAYSATSTHRSPGHSGSNSVRNSADQAIFAANAVSAEIDEVGFEVFADLAVGSTPPSIKRIMGAMDAPRSTGSKGSRHSISDHETSFDSVVSDLFNLSADTGCDSDEESSVFYHYRDNK